MNEVLTFPHFNVEFLLGFRCSSALVPQNVEFFRPHLNFYDLNWVFVNADKMFDNNHCMCIHPSYFRINFVNIK